MKTVYKYKIEDFKPLQNIEIYEGAEILKCGLIDDVHYIWALVDTEKPNKSIEIHSYFTGQPIEHSDLFFLKTYRVKYLVFHLFWRWV